MESASGYRAKPPNSNLQNSRIGLNPNTLLVIQLPDSKVLRVLSHSIFCAIVILTLPYMGPIINGASLHNSVDYHQDSSGFIDFEFFDLLWQDLCEKGFIREGHKALIVSSGLKVPIGGFQLSSNNEIDIIMETDLHKQKSLPDEAFDFAYVSGSVDLRSVDRIVKIGGVVAMQFNEHQKQSTYTTVYLRRFRFTIVAMKKNAPMYQTLPADSVTKRRLYQLSLESKKAALKGLEDVFLEPPRRGSTESINYLKKISFLPDLSGDSLESYPQLVFIDAGSLEERNGMMKWFEENYPKRNQEFVIYSLKMVSGEEGSQVGISDWLVRNVAEEEYVVMKAEAEAVEEMIERRTICLVDELFLECNNQWQGEEKKNKKKSKRAYWECLALYGRLKDEGVAMHQWWGL